MPGLHQSNRSWGAQKRGKFLSHNSEVCEDQSQDADRVAVLEFVKRPSLTKTTETATIIANPMKIFIDPTCWGLPSQHAGQRREQEQQKNTLFIPLLGADLSNRVLISVASNPFRHWLVCIVTK